jgi:[glutamine synthetase] adenylyltransferase / [glutamine synthetase]-adenylyl-L-tyrosine phosphorylase
VAKGGADIQSLASASLAMRIISAPKLSSGGAGQAAVKDWWQSISSTATANALGRLLEGRPTVSQLLYGIAEGSPYLWDLIRADPALLLALLQCSPEERLTRRLAEVSEAVDKAGDESYVMRLLRELKKETALLIALADIGAVWDVVEVTRALTSVADGAVAAAVRFLLADAAREGRFIPSNPTRPEERSGYVVIAMGKMGASELNYSSDIDLIVLFDPSASVLTPETEPTAFYVRLTKRLVRLLQERTSDGYVFRVDLRLRPDPGSTSIAISRPSALSYYESIGQNWERAALIKARPCAGDLAVGEAILADLSPFVWRRYLDFGAVADVYAMKRQLHAYKGHDEIAVEGHNIKLGRGGIREIEFFVQTQQLIAGGRHPNLRDRGTLATLCALAEGGWISVEARADLDLAYRFLRRVEHRLQMVADEQTHTLPSDAGVFTNFSHFLGFPDRDAFAIALLAHLQIVQRQYANLFEGEAPSKTDGQPLLLPPTENDHTTLDRLAELGFKRPQEVSATVRRWLSGDYRSLRSQFARDHLADLVPLFLDELARTENPDNALVPLDRFFSTLHRGPRFYSLLRQNRDLVALLATILGTAPRLADIVARRPEVMDALLDPTFFGPLPDESKLASALARSLGQARSFEDFLDRTRLFGQEQMFLVGVRILSGTVSTELAGEAFARLADALIRTIERAVEVEFAAVHGELVDQQFAVLALGKLGGREMTAGSDLDLIVVYDFDLESGQSNGQRPLHGIQYFSRLTQRLINALTTPTNYGRLYDVDMRLRPSGKSGPVATSFEAFKHYHDKEAWTWEHMALTRARVVLAPPALGGRIEQVIRQTLGRRRDRKRLAEDIVEMRRAIAAEKAEDQPWDLKYAAGGLVDIEFIAQYLQLVHAADHPELLDVSTARVLEKATRLGILPARESETLRPAAILYHDLTQALRLCVDGPFDPKSVGPALLALLARAADVPEFATLDAHLRDSQMRVRQSFNRIVGKV